MAEQTPADNGSAPPGPDVVSILAIMESSSACVSMHPCVCVRACVHACVHTCALGDGLGDEYTYGCALFGSACVQFD